METEIKPNLKQSLVWIRTAGGVSGSSGLYSTGSAPGVIPDRNPEHHSDQVEESDDRCVAMKSDHTRCKNMKYKNEKFYCYNHLEDKPRGRPPTKRDQPIDPVPNLPLALSSVLSPPAPEPVAAPVAVAATVKYLEDTDLLQKITSRLRVKIDSMSDDTKGLLRMLL